jgi:hypothetical protein
VSRIFLIVLMVSVVAASIGCGNVFVRGAINTGSSITGLVAGVQIGNVLSGTGATIQVTFVTFTQNGMSSTMRFCNDQTSLFPVGQTIRVNFNPGETCATIIGAVVID